MMLYTKMTDSFIEATSYQIEKNNDGMNERERGLKKKKKEGVRVLLGKGQPWSH